MEKYLKYKQKYVNIIVGGTLDPNDVEKQVKVETEDGVALLNLYKVGVEILMYDHQISVYKLYPKDGTIVNQDTVMISAVPSLQGYTFKVRLESDAKHQLYFYVTRLS